MANLLGELHRKRISPISLSPSLSSKTSEGGGGRKNLHDEIDSIRHRSIRVPRILKRCSLAEPKLPAQARERHAEWKSGSRKGRGEEVDGLKLCDFN